MNLEPHELHLWLSPERSADEAALRRLDVLLEPHEVEALGNFANDELRLRALRTRALVRTVLAGYLPGVDPGDLRFAKGEHGKPELASEFASSNLYFNLTHTDGLVALAVCRHRDVGIDAENLYERTTALKLARRYFTAEEARNMEALPPLQQPKRFYTLWTLKESWMKATGRGLMAGTDNAAFSLDANHQVDGLSFAAYDATDWRFWQFAPSAEHVVAVALRAPKVVRQVVLASREWRPGSGQEKGAQA